MLPLFKKYKAAIIFIAKFFLVYMVLTFVYGKYLDAFSGEPDSVTKIVANQSNTVINWFGYQGEVTPHESEPTMKMIINGKYVGRVIEGCNSISVLILFVTFVIAFAGPWKRTLIFILAGSALIYLVNVARIVILGIGLYEYPEKEYLLHQLIFPAIVYGMVLLLWMFWVNKFSKRS